MKAVIGHGEIERHKGVKAGVGRHFHLIKPGDGRRGVPASDPVAQAMAAGRHG